MQKHVILAIFFICTTFFGFSQQQFEGIIKYKTISEEKKYSFSAPETDTVMVYAYYSPGKILLRVLSEEQENNADLLILIDSLKFYMVFHDKKETESKSFDFKPFVTSSAQVIKGYNTLPFTSQHDDVNEIEATTYWLAEKLFYKIPGRISGDDDVAILNYLIRDNRIVLKAQSYEGIRTSGDTGLLNTPVLNNQACTRRIMEAIEVIRQKNNPALFNVNYLLNHPAK